MTSTEEQPTTSLVEDTATKRKLEESISAPVEAEAEPTAATKKEENPPIKKLKAEETAAKNEEGTLATAVKRAKGKGRSKIAQRYASEPEDDDDDDDEEEEVIDEHRIPEGDVEEDDLEEIDTSNIIVGRRTRGKVIDYKKINDELEKSRAAGETSLLGDDDDEEEDDRDFQDKE